MKLKNKSVLLAVIFIVLALSGYFLYKSNNSKNTELKNGEESKNGSVFTSIKDALSKDVTLYCDFNEGNVSFKSYIKNGAVRVTTSSTEKGQSGDMIMKNNKMYIWDSTTKTGFIYDVPEDSESSNVSVDSSSSTTGSTNYLGLIDQYKDSCKVTAVEDSLFVEPKDIDFKDMTKFLEDLQQQMPQVNIPQQ